MSVACWMGCPHLDTRLRPHHNLLIGGEMEAAELKGALLGYMKEMMVKLFTTYCCKCKKDVVDEVLEHPKVRRLAG